MCDCCWFDHLCRGPAPSFRRRFQGNPPSPKRLSAIEPLSKSHSHSACHIQPILGVASAQPLADFPPSSTPAPALHPTMSLPAPAASQVDPATGKSSARAEASFSADLSSSLAQWRKNKELERSRRLSSKGSFDCLSFRSQWKKSGTTTYFYFLLPDWHSLADPVLQTIPLAKYNPTFPGEDASNFGTEESGGPCPPFCQLFKMLPSPHTLSEVLEYAHLMRRMSFHQLMELWGRGGCFFGIAANFLQQTIHDKRVHWLRRLNHQSKELFAELQTSVLEIFRKLRDLDEQEAQLLKSSTTAGGRNRGAEVRK